MCHLAIHSYPLAAFTVNDFAAPARDCRCNSTAVHQLGIGSVDNGIRGFTRDIPLADLQVLAGTELGVV